MTGLPQYFIGVKTDSVLFLRFFNQQKKNVVFSSENNLTPLPSDIQTQVKLIFY